MSPFWGKPIGIDARWISTHRQWPTPLRGQSIFHRIGSAAILTELKWIILGRANQNLENMP